MNTHKIVTQIRELLDVLESEHTPAAAAPLAFVPRPPAQKTWWDDHGFSSVTPIVLYYTRETGAQVHQSLADLETQGRVCFLPSEMYDADNYRVRISARPSDVCELGVIGILQNGDTKKEDGNAPL